MKSEKECIQYASDVLEAAWIRGMIENNKGAWLEEFEDFSSNSEDHGF